jgi:hypothetical protein
MRIGDVRRTLKKEHMLPFGYHARIYWRTRLAIEGDCDA